MKYFFSELDEVTLTFGDIQKNSSGMEFIRIYFEKPVDYGFNFLESTLPALAVTDSKGFTDDEKKYLLNYAMRNAFLIWDIAREKAGA